MQSLPPELHSFIVELTCASSPGAQTPRALALTSTYFHAVAAPFLFDTIAVSSEDRASHLLALLESTPAHQRRIHHLFLGPTLCMQSVLRLLYFAAPTLHDLAVAGSSSLLAAVFRMHMPQLRVLSVRGFYPVLRPGAFPRLTHLHVAGNHSPVGLPLAVVRACPALTHLCVSSLQGAPAFARALRALLEGGGTLLMSVILEAQKPDTTNRVAQARDVEMRDILGAMIAKRDDENRPRVRFSEGIEKTEEKLKAAWLAMAWP